MNDKFEEWWKKERYNMGVNDKRNFNLCWRKAIESTKEKHSEPSFNTINSSYGCFFRTNSNPWDYCILIVHGPSYCEYARNNGIKSETGCPYWRQIED